MTDINESELEAWQEDTAFLVKTLADIFESTDFRYYIDEINETLYVELEGLHDYSDDEIAELAEPVFEELDLDFENIVLLPLQTEQ
ncbi:MAG: hypothetical protein WD355_04845 [Balneolaceae bacterium]